MNLVFLVAAILDYSKCAAVFLGGDFMDSDSGGCKVTFLKKSAFYIFLRGCSIILHHTLGVEYRNLCQDFTTYFGILL